MVKGGYCHAGQVRVSTQRIFVHADVQAEFVDRFVARVRALRVGDPLATETEVGPLIHPREADRVQSWIEEAAAGGARIVVGGERGAAGHPAICRRGGTLPTTCHPCRHGLRWTNPLLSGTVFAAESGTALASGSEARQRPCNTREPGVHTCLGSHGQDPSPGRGVHRPHRRQTADRAAGSSHERGARDASG